MSSLRKEVRSLNKLSLNKDRVFGRRNSLPAFLPKKAVTSQIA
ncbi:hypothetical protein BVI434_850111 [Burkholderia vietnamiensis]|jgi:hypothetical protein|nr:hypothetical protein BVI434_850111 [Burkholderia vietnamiensis]